MTSIGVGLHYWLMVASYQFFSQPCTNSVPCPFQEATVALKVDEMWKKVYERRQDLMEEWIQCFRDGPVDAVDESKWEIRKSLTEYGTNPRKNFLLRLMSCDPSLRGFRYFRQMCE